MKTRSAEFMAEIVKGNICRFNLVKIGTDCFTNSPHAITFNEEVYVPYEMAISGFRGSDVSPLSGGAVQFANADSAMSAIVLSRAFLGATAYVWEAYFDVNMALIAADLVCAGTVPGRGAATTKFATFQISPLNPQTQLYPRTRITRQRYPSMPVRGAKFTAGNVIVEVK